MDYIEKLAQQASQMTMYDVKTYYNQAKNAVLNVSETEAKVREATNDDPWGASSTLMQEIADGTQNFAQFNEIMPTIYARFMEKEAREWRQIYKALTLLEFLVKNGSERVVDDARAHVSTIKMLRSFHYIDEKGKDQGINVRNRASEIATLLGDLEKIRQERRKAKANKAKYGGVGSDGGMSFTQPGGGRFGGFGSESVNSGGGGGGSGSASYRGGGGYDSGGDDYRRRASPQAAAEFDEYEGADDFADTRRTGSSTSQRTARPQPPPKGTPRAPKVVEKPKEVNLFDFGDDEPAPAAPVAPVAAKQEDLFGGDDDFDDFQSAPAAPAPAPAAKPAPAAANNNLFDLLNQGATKPTSQAPAYSGPSPGLSMPSLAPTPVSRPSYTSPAPAPAPAAKPAPSKSTFDDLFNTSLTSMGGQANGGQKAGQKSMKDLEKEKSMNALWAPAGQSSQSGQGQNNKSSGGEFDDLLM